MSFFSSALALVNPTAAIGTALASGAVESSVNNYYNKKAAKKAYEREIDLMDRQNAYNTPSAQMERLKEAGLNPALVYGNGTVSGNTSATPSQVAQAKVSQFKTGMVDAMVSAMQFLQNQQKIDQAQDMFDKTNDREWYNSIIRSEQENQRILQGTLKLGLEGATVFNQTLKTGQDLAFGQEQLKQAKLNNEILARDFALAKRHGTTFRNDSNLGFFRGLFNKGFMFDGVESAPVYDESLPALWRNLKK